MSRFYVVYCDYDNHGGCDASIETGEEHEGAADEVANGARWQTDSDGVHHYCPKHHNKEPK